MNPKPDLESLISHIASLDLIPNHEPRRRDVRLEESGVYPIRDLWTRARGVWEKLLEEASVDEFDVRGGGAGGTLPDIYPCLVDTLPDLSLPEP